MESNGDRLKIAEKDARREKVARWLGEKVTSFALAETEKRLDERPRAFEVRSYQLDAWANLWEARHAGQKRALIHLATGLGKTSVGVFDMMKFREEQLAKTPPVIPRALFVSHMNDISEQARERFEYFMPELETDYFKTRRPDIPDVDITFATFQSLRSELGRFDPQAFDYIIYDEAHHSEASTFKNVRDYFDPQFELALTATPGRVDALDIMEYFGEPLYDKTLVEGIAEGWLADVDYYIVFDDTVKQVMEEGFEPTTLQEFHDLFRHRPRNEVIARNIREEQHRIGLDDAKTIIFCEDVVHAKEMAELLDGVAYHSRVKKDKRKKILQGFRGDTHKVICTIDMFNEGIDIPDARLLVFLRSTRSGNIFEQQLGRGLRRAPGKDKVSVLDFVANVERIQKIRALSRRIYDATPDEETDQQENNDDAELGVHIRMKHSEFDFNKMAVDLLKMYKPLKQEASSPFAKMNNDAIIELALKRSPEKQLGRRAIDKLARKGLFPHSSTITVKFGSIIAFQQACGFSGERESKYTKVGLIEQLQAKAIELGRTPTITDINSDPDFPDHRIYGKFFGGYSNALAAANLAPNNAKFADDEMLELYLEYARSLGRLPDGDDMKAGVRPGNIPGQATYQKRFGWTNLKRQVAERLADEDIMVDVDTIEKPMLIERLAKYALMLGRMPTTQDMDSEQRPSWVPSIAALKHKGGWVNIKRQVAEQLTNAGHEGFEVRALLSSLGKDELVSLALELSPTKALTEPAIRRLSKEGKFVSNGFIDKLFGSLLNFQRACGFERINSRNLSDQDIIALARELKSDGPLSIKEVNDLCKAGRFVSSNTILRRFGSLHHFQRACGFDGK